MELSGDNSIYSIVKVEKSMVKKLLREKYPTILLIVGFIISAFVAINVLAVQNEVQKQIKEANGFNNYENVLVKRETVPSSKAWDSIVSQIQQIDSDENMNIFGMGYYSVVGDGYANPCTYAMLSGKPVKTNVIWGRDITEEEIKNGEKVLTLSTKLEQYCYEKNNKKYIKLDDEEYEVVGIYKAKDMLSEKFSMDICMYYSSMLQTTRTCMCEYSDVVLLFKCAGYNVTQNECKQTADSLYNVLKDNGYIRVNGDGFEDENKLLGAKVIMNNIFMCITFVFTVLNCMIISGVWIKRRYKELVIRRTYGWSMADIILLLAKDLALYSFIAIIIGVILQSLYSFLFSAEHLSMQYITGNVLYMLAVMAGVVVAALIIPVVRIRYITPAGAIRKKQI